jgi:oxygen-independent coproporphyrinogen-3 oxidase
MTELSSLLAQRYPRRTRPIGFYPLPSQRLESGTFDERFEPFPTAIPRTGLLYLHVPFCQQRCSFCRFFVNFYRDADVEQYVALLLEEIRRWGRLRDRTPNSGPVEAIFFGGGTPSALDPSQLARIIGALRDSFEFAPKPEITVEWYPKDADAGLFDAVRELGVNRLSFGVQTWNPRTAEALGAHHSGDDVEAVLTLADEAGFRLVNIDLMMNVPGQTVEEMLEDLERALAWRPAMISTNPLEVTAGTLLAIKAKREAFVERDAAKRRWLALATERLREAGYAHQRMRNFARDGLIHRYNRACLGIAYDIVPLGPRAYGFVGGWALSNALTVEDWGRLMSDPASDSVSVIGVAEPTLVEMKRSFVIASLLELRIPAVVYRNEFGCALSDDFPFVAHLVEDGALLEDEGTLLLSQDAIPYADDIGAETYSSSQHELFARHLAIKQRAKDASQYFPVV